MTQSLTRVDRPDGAVELHIVVHGDPDRIGAVIGEALDALDAALCIDTTSRRVRSHGAEVELTRLEYELLLFLASHPGRVFDREALTEHVWRLPGPSRGRTIDVHVRKLRSKIDRFSITTVRGIGYRFDGRADIT
ncbi:MULTISPECIES: winged helix-turn-helix domain-containing protein [Amycolatopsis]|uniref:Winged helix-turn-helix domain-containing protein n=1 Tax=Amycolatopsis thermalba TaxID=944492 RepID=A0ABY4NW88_9PSEU|nr:MULTISPECIES: winged helix-turn-helix domain-containing protein [Amycolatopsis]OXM62833.1 transcriptional regulator [Amycolatopsis sp. KNN50.9b]UQS24321.1 winged helix-turn-helix domain-containing protein [Amycolatopsis thermalba]